MQASKRLDGGDLGVTIAALVQIWQLLVSSSLIDCWLPGTASCSLQQKIKRLLLFRLLCLSQRLFTIPFHFAFSSCEVMAFCPSAGRHLRMQDLSARRYTASTSVQPEGSACCLPEVCQEVLNDRGWNEPANVFCISTRQ